VKNKQATITTNNTCTTNYIIVTYNTSYTHTFNEKGTKKKNQIASKVMLIKKICNSNYNQHNITQSGGDQKKKKNNENDETMYI